MNKTMRRMGDAEDQNGGTQRTFNDILFKMIFFCIYFTKSMR